jgi:hypothetical protein
LDVRGFVEECFEAGDVVFAKVVDVVEWDHDMCIVLLLLYHCHTSFITILSIIILVFVTFFVSSALC